MFDWEQYRQFFEIIEIPAKTVLLREGTVAKKIYFVKSGCLRLWFNNDGKDVTFQFFFEGQSIASIESFRNNVPSQFSIETIAPCSLFCMTKSDFLSIIASSPATKKQMDDYSFERLFSYQRLFLSRIKNSPQERYLELLAGYPEIFQRIPQHYIASYLGITPVSLSRIRNRIKVIS